MSTPLRGTCTACGRRFRLTVEGVVYAHQTLEDHGSLLVSDICAGAYISPVEGSVRAPRVEYDAVGDLEQRILIGIEQAKAGKTIDRGDYMQEIPWSWWDAHGWKVWMGMLWIGGAMFGSGITIIIRNLAEGRGWLG